MSKPLFILSLSISVILFGQVLRLWNTTDHQIVRKPAVLLFLVLFSFQTLLLSLHLIEPFTFIESIRPLTAALVPASCYWMIVLLMREESVVRFKDSIHLMPFAINALELVSFDYSIIIIQLLYAVLMLSLLFDTRIKSIRPLQAITLFFGASFIVIGLMDFYIALEIRAGSELKDSLALFISLLFVYSILLCGVVLSYVNPSAISQLLSDVQFAAHTAFPSVNKQQDSELQSKYDFIYGELTDKEYYLEEDFDLSFFAQKLDMAPREVSQLINQFTKKTFSGFVNDIKISKAQKLLKAQPTASITQIMFDSGFTTKSSFNREFLSRVGISPSKYRNT